MPALSEDNGNPFFTRIKNVLSFVGILNNSVKGKLRPVVLKILGQTRKYSIYFIYLRRWERR